MSRTHKQLNKILTAIFNSIFKLIAASRGCSRDSMGFLSFRACNTDTETDALTAGIMEYRCSHTY